MCTSQLSSFQERFRRNHIFYRTMICGPAFRYGRKKRVDIPYWQIRCISDQRNPDGNGFFTGFSGFLQDGVFRCKSNWKMIE